MTTTKRPYWAPSTHTENRGDPLLHIGGDDGGQIVVAVRQLLPERLTLAVKHEPIWCPLHIHFAKGHTLYTLYQHYPAMQSVLVRYQHRGFFTEKNDILPLRDGVHFDLRIPENGVLYTMRFLHVSESQECPSGISTYPLGGRNHEDPKECRQLFIEVNSTENSIKVNPYVQPEEEKLLWQEKYGSLEGLQSLGDHIETQKIAVVVTYEGTHITYRSYRYRLHNDTFFYIDFLKEAL